MQSKTVANTPVSKAFAPKPFKVPKMRIPAKWQGVVERPFNMLQVGEEANIWVPGRATRSMIRTTP